MKNKNKRYTWFLTVEVLDGNSSEVNKQIFRKISVPSKHNSRTYMEENFVDPVLDNNVVVDLYTEKEFTKYMNLIVKAFHSKPTMIDD